MAAVQDLQARWKYLYAEYLPQLAQAKDPAQARWPVYLDHCFARIVLDNAVGIDQPWTQAIKSPAIGNMTQKQLDAAIKLAEDIACGQADLVALDQQSLQLRGKKPKPATKRAVPTETDDEKVLKKHKRGDETISSYFLPSPSSPRPKEQSAGQDPSLATPAQPSADISTEGEVSDMSTQLKRIEESNLTTFRKQTLSLLCGIPRGRYSTYQAMSDHISATSHKTCARAVGNAMRNNPFAPEVPCHRILAADGSLGGFGGSWGENGKHAGKKRALLQGEGVKFDSKGKVKGPVFREWK